MISSFIIYFLLLTVKSSFVFGDPCTTYQELGTAEDSSRSVAYSGYDNSICDAQLTEGWYRIPSKAGERMPTECVLGGSRCGAQSPIWMNGTLPDIGIVHNATGYVADLFGNCFAESFDIQVKNCSSFLVYYLKPVSNCNQRYCFGSELPCPSGQTSDNGFSPGCKFDPCLPVNYNELDQWNRSTGYQETSDNCDNFLEPGWYRPVSLVGNAMPTQCQKGGFRCGTSNPIWMNGSHPEAGQTADVTACVSNYNGDCCSQAYNIQVKNCYGYYVYNLTPTNGCYQAYCFGNESKCPVGETSDNGGFTPGCEFDPCHKTNYEILQGEMKRSSNYTLQPDDTAIEDSRLPTGWYKIDSVTGNDIVNETVSMMQCGTVNPLWMQGGIPSEAEKTVDRKVCRSNHVTDCVEKYDIKIRNCGSYRTYYLNTLDVGQAAYCFGTLPVPPTTTTTTATSTTTTTMRPNVKKNSKENIPKIIIIIVLAVCSLLVVFLTAVMALWCYKKWTSPKRAVSFVQLDRVSSPPPTYDDAVGQNEKNNKINQLHEISKTATHITSLSESIPPKSTGWINERY